MSGGGSPTVAVVSVVDDRGVPPSPLLPPPSSVGRLGVAVVVNKAYPCGDRPVGVAPGGKRWRVCLGRSGWVFGSSGGKRRCPGDAFVT